MSTQLQPKPSTTTPRRESRDQRGMSGKAYEATNRDARSNPRRVEPRERSASPVVQPEETVASLSAIRAVRKKSSLGLFFGSFSFVKCFTLFGFVVAAVHIVLFGLDLAVAWPLQRASILYDINSVICGVALACLSWGVFRDQVREAR